MAPGLLTVVRQNPIKSSITLTTGGLGIAWYIDYNLTKDMMNGGCARAATLGDKRLVRATDTVRHITVLINPTAGKRRSRKLYEKWVEPLLLLAGVKVSVVETGSPGQAESLMKVMANCDCVAIVGGDGTVNEAINGLLSRQDCATASKSIPIGIIPTGLNNSIARYLNPSLRYRNQKEFLIQTTLMLLEGNTHAFDVLKVTSLAKTDSTYQQTTNIAPSSSNLNLLDKPVYALRDVRYGAHQSDYFKLGDYMFYEKYIKPYITKVRMTLRSSQYPWPQIASLSYTKPCEGCTKCFKKHLLANPEKSNVEKIATASANKRWWSMIVPMKPKPTLLSAQELKQSQAVNESCDHWTRIETLDNISDLRTSMMGQKMVRLSVSRNGKSTPTEIVEAQDVELKLKPELDKQALEFASKKLEKLQTETADASEPPENGRKKEKEVDKNTKFLIDGQPVDAQSIYVTTVSNAVTMYSLSIDS